MLYRVEGIVIRSVAYGEGNVIITLFTEEYGKIGMMVRGAKKAKSRHAAVTQLYTYGEYVYYKSNGSSLGTLNSGELLDAFPGIRSDLRASAYAAYFAELIDRVVPDGEASAYVYAQFKAGLEALTQGKDPEIVARLLELKLFRFAGIAPVLDACAGCGSVWEEGMNVGWSVASGGAVCARCGAGTADRRALQGGVLKLLRVLQRADLRRIGEINVKPQTKAALKQALRQWMDVHLDVRLKTRQVLDQIEAVYDES